MSEEAILLVVTVAKDKDGFPVETVSEVPIWAREKSATRTEFYDALRAGITVKTVFEVRQEDFELSARMAGGKKEYATRISFDGSTYDIIRTYRKDKAMMELVCC